jgi:tetratricopeptide (TPR) repeat protein
MRIRRLLAMLAVLCASAAPLAQEQAPPSFAQAVELVHAFNGAGDELGRAAAIAQALGKSHPDRGYAEALQAELLSTWNLDQSGAPTSLFTHILQLTDRALALNPRLAQAHVARARALLRASRVDEATKAIDTALALEPRLTGAYFLRAEIYRRDGKTADAETWYLKFIAETTSVHRKSNSYYWLARTYEDGASPARAQEYAVLISKARAAYEKSVELDPDGPWKNANFALFLNNDGGDFLAAERYAAKAVSIADFPFARYQLAIARYQKLMPLVTKKDDMAVWRGVNAVSRSTGISLNAAIESAHGSLASSRLALIRQAAARAAP